MNNLTDEIYKLMRKSKNMREVYRKFPQLSDQELYNELLAQSKIEERIQREPVLKEALEGFLNLFNWKPSEILDKTEYEDEIGVRRLFEETKREYNISGGRKNFGTDKGVGFKFGINSEGGNEGSFGVNPNDLSF